MPGGTGLNRHPKNCVCVSIWEWSKQMVAGIGVKKAGGLMKRYLFGLALLLAPAAAATASPILLFSDVLISDVGTPAPLGITPALVGPAGFGGGVITGDVGLDVPGAGTLTISLQDLGLVGDVYEVVLDGASLGLTSATSINDPTNSSGVFNAPIAAGFHTIGLWDFVLTFAGGTSPYGGAIPFGRTSNEVQLTVALDVPEPTSLALIGTALAMLGTVRRRTASA